MTAHLNRPSNMMYQSQHYQLPKATGAEFHEPPSSSTVTEGSPLQPPPISDEETKKWGSHVMGPPPAPNVHPDNQC